MKPITDRAEIALEYPDKLYVGTFERSSQFEAHPDETGIALTFCHGGGENERKSVHMHINYGLFSDILFDLAKTITALPVADAGDRETMAQAAAALRAALQPAARSAPPAKARRAPRKR